MSRLHTITQTNYLPVPVETAWKFFAQPKNLLLLTPPTMQLQITNDVSVEEVYQGQKIELSIKPLFGISVKWKTEIIYVEKHKLFIDIQTKGPYSFWEHRHLFDSSGNGTEITDVIKYKMPYGIIGDLLHAVVIRNKLNQLFHYRTEKIKEIFAADVLSNNNINQASW